MTIYEKEKIEDILNKYTWKIPGYNTNIKIYKDLIKIIPQLNFFNINLYEYLTINEWVDYINKAFDLRIKIENREKIINKVLNE